MLQTHFIFLLALGLFAASAARLVYCKAIFSPQFIAAMTFLLMGVLALMPQMKFSGSREYSFGTKTQVFVLIAAAIYFATTFFMRAPKLRPEYLSARWKFLPRRGWLFLFFLVCLTDPLLSLFLYGNVGLVKGNQSMGSGGGGHSEVFTPVTFFAWAFASMAVTMLMTDFLFSFASISAYLKKRIFDVLLVAGCLMCTALSGNRFVLICQLISVVIGLALFGRLRTWMISSVVVFLGLFFVVVGNFRFGTLDVVDNLRRTTGIGSVDMVYAWVVTYSEPTFPNLDNFIKDEPAALWGLGWLTTVTPSQINDLVGLDRKNSADWFSENSLYAYHGLTFRTMYPDLIMDFGIKGALILSTLFLALGVRIYNRSLRSPFYFVLFLTYSPLILFSPALAAYYSLPNLVPFGILFIIKKKGRRAPGENSELPDDEPALDEELAMEHAETGTEQPYTLLPLSA